MESWKSPGIYFGQDSANPVMSSYMHVFWPLHFIGLYTLDSVFLLVVSYSVHVCADFRDFVVVLMLVWPVTQQIRTRLLCVLLKCEMQ